MANVGDIVVFKHHVCTIAQKRENYFDGKDYWELHAVFERSLKLFIACDAAKSPAMRPVMQKQEAIDLIDSIADTKPVNLEDDVAATAKTSSLHQRQIKEVYESYLKTLSQKTLCRSSKHVTNAPSRARNAGIKPPRSIRNTSIWPKGFYAMNCRFRLRFRAIK